MIRHAGVTLSEAGRKLLASFYFVLLVIVIAAAGIWIAATFGR